MNPLDQQAIETVIPYLRTSEGLSLHAYPDPGTGGKPITIGYGNTQDREGKLFKMGDTITTQQAEDLLRLILETKMLRGLQRIPTWNGLTLYQKVALFHFAFNVGANFYGGQHFNTITRALSSKENLGNVPHAMMLYVNPGSNVEAGLRKRRRLEVLLWNKGSESNPQTEEITPKPEYNNTLGKLGVDGACHR